MSFDDDMLDFQSEFGKKSKSTPQSVSDTYALGQKLIDEDYLPKISKIKKLKPYLEKFKHMNLYNHGWRFQFGSSKQWAGLCSGAGSVGGDSVKGKDIFISIQFTKHDENWENAVRGTILHEISHAILFEIFPGAKGWATLHKLDDLHTESKGHGVIWKSVCKALSGDECRIKYEFAEKKASFKNYKYTCVNCGNVEYGDYSSFADECNKCGKGVIVEQNRI